MKRNKNWLYLIIILTTFSISCATKKNVRPELLSGPGWTTIDNNLHLIEGPPPGKDAPMAFRVYRSGVPSKETFAKWCSEYKIKRVIDLAGTADKNERAFQKQGICPDIEIIYSEKQTPEQPLSSEFLKFFDAQIEKARKDNVGILLRCTSGSHRAGRLSAYYQMKYQGLTPDEAIAVMDYNGVMMPLYDPILQPQVRALYDYIKNQPCSQKKEFCVRQ
jgi:protein-tyrosine phosphatase